MPRVPELDSLRALAAFIVLLFHIRPQRFYFGWTGVDLFFVLSGYLITAIILDHVSSRRFFVHFYVRRGLRIWPIYYLTLFGLVLANPHLPKRQPMDALPYYLTYTQNVPSYWHRPMPPFNPAFDHTWTLALEEQFYLLWPALVAWAGPRRLVRLCLAVVTINLLAREGGYFTYNQLSERLLVARSDGFALGGLLAALLADRERLARHRARFRLGFGLAGLAALVYLAVGMALTDPIGFIGLPTPIWPVLTIFAVALLYFGLIGVVLLSAGHPALAPLRLGPLVYLGRISYGIYIYHYIIYWAIDGFDFNYDRPWRINVLKVAATVAAAMLSWHLIERPILSLKDYFRYEPGPATRPAVAVPSDMAG
jgi:peptidoglycan/LPS O-acetylase OafA/YrhL